MLIGDADTVQACVTNAGQDTRRTQLPVRLRTAALAKVRAAGGAVELQVMLLPGRLHSVCSGGTQRHVHANVHCCSRQADSSWLLIGICGGIRSPLPAAGFAPARSPSLQGRRYCCCCCGPASAQHHTAGKLLPASCLSQEQAITQLAPLLTLLAASTPAAGRRVECERTDSRSLAHLDVCLPAEPASVHKSHTLPCSPSCSQSGHIRCTFHTHSSVRPHSTVLALQQLA